MTKTQQVFLLLFMGALTPIALTNRRTCFCGLQMKEEGTSFSKRVDIYDTYWTGLIVTCPYVRNRCPGQCRENTLKTLDGSRAVLSDSAKHRACELSSRPTETSKGLHLDVIHKSSSCTGDNSDDLRVENLCCSRSCSCNLQYQLDGNYDFRPLTVRNLRQPSINGYMQKYYPCGTEEPLCETDCMRQVGKALQGRDVSFTRFDSTSARAVCSAVNQPIDRPLKVFLQFNPGDHQLHRKRLDNLGTNPTKICCKRKCTCSLVYQDSTSSIYHPLSVSIQQPSIDQYNYPCGTEETQCIRECTRQAGKAFHGRNEDFGTFDKESGTKACEAVNRNVAEPGMKVFVQYDVGNGQPIKRRQLDTVCCLKLPDAIAAITGEQFVPYCI